MFDDRTSAKLRMQQLYLISKIFLDLKIDLGGIQFEKMQREEDNDARLLETIEENKAIERERKWTILENVVQSRVSNIPTLIQERFNRIQLNFSRFVASGPDGGC